MENDTRVALQNLKSALDLDSRTLSLAEVEKRLEDSDEVKSLSEKAKVALEDFAYAQSHFGNESELTKEKQRALYLAKKALDEHPLSMEYGRHYAAVRSLYSEIDALLIGPYRDKRVCLERKK